jgi:glycosyltransferase involved in cell wall biosynthesis
LRFCGRKFTKAVAAQLSQRRVDLVIGVDYTSLEVFEFAKRKGIISVLSLRTQHPVILQRVMKEELHRRGIRRHRFLDGGHIGAVSRQNREIALADYILCPSQSVIDSMMECGVPLRKLILMPFGADLERFDGQSTISQDGVFRLLFVGKVGHRKGIPYLIEAFEQLGLPNSELVLIGGLDAPANTLPEFRPPVTHVGWVPPDELNRYYSSSSVFVLASLSEGSALVSYEAMAARLPIIATSASGTLVRHGKDGLVIPPGDVEALKESIVRLYYEPELRRQMGENARERIRAYSWDDYHHRVAAAIHKIWWERREND